MKAVNPYLSFAGNAEEAFAFYAGVFGTQHLGVVRFRSFGDQVPGVREDELDLVAHIALPMGGGSTLMASDVPVAHQPDLVVGTNTHIHLEADSVDEAERLFAALTDGGSVVMPIARSAWAERYGMGADRFQVQWMVSYTGNARFDGGEAG
jgi:PhnB protein